MTILKMIKLAWESRPRILMGIFFVETLNGLFPLANAWLTKLLFDLLAQNLQSIKAGLSREFILVLAAQFSLSILGYILGLFNTYLKSEMGRRLAIHTQTKIYGKINSLTGLAYFEDSKFYNTIELASQGAQRGPSRTLYNVTAMLRNLLVLLSFLGTLLIFNPLLVIILSISIVPQFYAQMKMGRQRVNLTVANTLGQRKASYYGNLLSNNHFIKEVRLFNLADWLLNLLLQTVQKIHETQRQQEIRELHNPGQNDHQLRRMPITDYGGCRSQIAADADHFSSD